MEKSRWILFVLVILLFTPIVYGQEGYVLEFEYDGQMRSSTVFEPSLEPSREGFPLVIGLHGAGSDANHFIGTAFLIRKAVIEKFVIACPNSLKYPHMAWWNAGDGYEEITEGTDDLGFISALIDTMIENYNIDTTRIYIMGHSNGSMMAYRVAAELSNRIAAIAVNSGQMVYEFCDPDYPVPIIHFHGLADSTCPYEGVVKEHVTLPPVDSVMSIWRGVNNCSSFPETIYDENGIVGQKWSSPGGSGDIILYTMEGWGHKWPRRAEPGIHAIDVMWDFLKVHRRIL